MGRPQQRLGIKISRLAGQARNVARFPRVAMLARDDKSGIAAEYERNARPGHVIPSEAEESDRTDEGTAGSFDPLRSLEMTGMGNAE